MNSLILSIFSAGQLSVILILCILFVLFIALNIWFAIIWRVKAERRMHNESLQDRRDALLAKLDYLKSGGETEPHTWIDFALFGDDDEEEETAAAESANEVTVPADDGKQPPNTVILAVDETSPRMRAKLNMSAKRFNGKKFYVRYMLGFDAKLRLSDDDTKKRYVEIMDELRSYEGVTFKKNFSNQQLKFGKELLANVVFSGKRLCVALALNPEDYANTKYHGDDKSDKKKFAKTPLVVRILSANKVEVAKYLFGKIAERYQFVKLNDKTYKYDLEEKSRDQLVLLGSMRVVIVKEISPLSPQFNADKPAEQLEITEAAAMKAEDRTTNTQKE